MIDSLTILNHESHKKTRLLFSPGLNIFIGETDAGKSSAFRAARLLFFNQPLGDGMLPKFWEGQTKIVGRFSDPASTVSRIKGKGMNHYQLDKQDPVNAGSKAPPEEILQALQIDQLNFQTQPDRAFLMFDTPGERGRVINKVAGLDEIDRAITNSLKDEQRLNREYKAEKAILKAFRADVKVYDDLDERETKIAFLEKVEVFARQSENNATDLQNLIEQADLVELKLEVAKKLAPAEKELIRLSGILDQITETESGADVLEKLVDKDEVIELKLEKNLPLLGMEKQITELEALPSKIKQAEDRAGELQTLLTKLAIIDRTAERINKEVLGLEKKLPKDCPTCGAVIKK